MPTAFHRPWRVWKFGCLEVLQPSYAAIPILDFVEVEWQLCFLVESHFTSFIPQTFGFRPFWSTSLCHLPVRCEFSVFLSIDRSIKDRVSHQGRSRIPSIASVHGEATGFEQSRCRKLQA